MRGRDLGGALLALGLAALGGLALAQGESAPAPVAHGPLVVEAPWLRATPGGATVGAGYLTIRNSGTEADRLTKVSIAGAERVEIHEMRETDGVMRMRQLAEPLEVAPGAAVTLAPGGMHLMLMGLARPLVAGETVAVTLVFEKAGEVTVPFAVAPVGASGHGAPGHDRP